MHALDVRVTLQSNVLGAVMKYTVFKSWVISVRPCSTVAVLERF